MSFILLIISNILTIFFFNSYKTFKRVLRSIISLWMLEDFSKFSINFTSSCFNCKSKRITRFKLISIRSNTKNKITSCHMGIF